MTFRRRAVRVYLEAASRKREAEFLQRVKASQKLHRPWLSAPHTSDLFRELVSRARKPSQESFFVCLIETAELVGVINLNEIVRGLFQSAYLGYYAFEPFAGEGYMTEGVTLVLDQAFGPLGLNDLQARLPSRRVLAPLSQNRRSLVRSRALGGAGGRMEWPQRAAHGSG